jgi:hypothetical protein
MKRGPGCRPANMLRSRFAIAALRSANQNTWGTNLESDASTLVSAVDVRYITKREKESESQRERERSIHNHHTQSPL